MAGFLPYALILLLLIVLIGFLNEKTTKLTAEIALLLYSAGAGGIIVILAAAFQGTTVSGILSEISIFNIESFLMEGVLCFMLFAGSCHMKLSDFRRLARPVGILAFLCTLLGAVFYGTLFFGVSVCMGLSFSYPMCLMFGSIVAPTDPIAATSILKKFGLPEDTGFLIEGESLLNDGVGVALFVCFSGIVSGNSKEGFFTVMIREIGGALIIGTAVTAVFFLIFRKTEDENRRIFVSLLNVIAAYWLCEHFSCSGALASVVCGVLFAALRTREEERQVKWDLEIFDYFWEIVDNLLNSVLYVILGLTFIRILEMPRVLILSAAAVICNLAGRFAGLGISTCCMKEVPDGFSKGRFSALLTWGGLRGGLSIALAMSTAEFLPESTYHIVLGCTYAIVFFTTVFQGLTMEKVYRRLRQ